MKLAKAFLEILETKDLNDIDIVELDECINKINALDDTIKVFISGAALN